MRNLVLFLDSSLFGGIESHIVELVKLMKSQNVPVSVLFYQDHHNQQLYDLLTENQCAYQCLSGRAQDLFHYLKKKRRLCSTYSWLQSGHYWQTDL